MIRSSLPHAAVVSIALTCIGTGASLLGLVSQATGAVVALGLVLLFFVLAGGFVIGCLIGLFFVAAFSLLQRSTA